MAAGGMNKAGPVTFAVGLISVGLVLLLYNLGAVTALGWVWKLWPLLLIGIGLEYFVKRSLHREGEVHFHLPSIILIILFMLLGGAAYAISSVGFSLGGLAGGIPWYHEDRLTYVRSWESGAVPVNAGERLLVDNKLGMIELLPAGDGELSVQAVIRASESGPARSLAGQMEPKVTRADGLVTVQVPNTENWERINNRVATDLTIRVPRGLAVEIQSGAGRVAAGDLDNDLKFDGNTGSVELNNLSGRMEVRNNTGRIEIKNPGGDVIAGTNTGSIKMTSDRPLAAGYELTSSTGLVFMEIPGDSSLKINAVSRTGNISVTGAPDGQVRRDGLRAEYHHTLGEGKGEAELEVGTGSVQIILR